MDDLCVTRPITIGATTYVPGEIMTPRSATELTELAALPSFRKATKADISKWKKRLANDPALRAVRETTAPQNKKDPESKSPDRDLDKPPQTKDPKTGGAKSDGGLG